MNNGSVYKSGVKFVIAHLKRIKQVSDIKINSFKGTYKSLSHKNWTFLAMTKTQAKRQWCKVHSILSSSNKCLPNLSGFLTYLIQKYVNDRVAKQSF